MLRLFLISIWLSLPLLSFAATGDDCRNTLPSSLNKSGMSCKILCDYPGTDIDCAIIPVPLTISACHTFIYVYTLTGTTPGYDDWKVISLPTNATVTGLQNHSLGVLDDDGTVTAGFCPGSASSTTCGGSMVQVFGPVLPYMFLDSGTTSGTTPDFIVHLLQYECPSVF